MRHQQFKLGNILVVENLAIRGPLQSHHGKAPIGCRQCAAETLLQAERPEELGEEYARPLGLLRQ
jgi:hypothetical protein